MDLCVRPTAVSKQCDSGEGVLSLAIWPLYYLAFFRNGFSSATLDVE